MGSCALAILSPSKIMDTQTTYERMLARYEAQETPWDHELPPPEVMALTEHLPPGYALDLGCGYGRASIYLAQRGWQVDAVDFVQMALVEAQRRARQAAVSVNFFRADITALQFLAERYTLAIDVGCAHGLSPEQWSLHHAELKRLLRPRAYYLLYGRLRQPADEWGLDEAFLCPLFENGFALRAAVHGWTDMGDGSPWPSAWFTFQRQEVIA